MQSDLRLRAQHHRRDEQREKTIQRETDRLFTLLDDDVSR